MQKRIGLMLDLTDNYDLEVAKGVLRFARERGDWRPVGQGWFLDPEADLQSWRGDGIITRIFDLHMYRRNVSSGVMLVDVAGAESAPEYAQVTNDDEAAGHAAGSHLIARGLGQLAFLGVKGDDWSEKRLAGVRRSAADAGRAAVHAREISERWVWDPEKYADLKAWLSGLPKPCGLVVTDGAMAVKAMRAVGEAGMEIPSDLSVVVLGNEDVLYELGEPSLTSIACDCQRIGYEAARRLAWMLETGTRAPEPVRVAPRPLTIRESTALVLLADEAVAAALSFIDVHANRSIHPGDVARAAGVGLRALEGRFKAAVGHSLGERLLASRLELARRHIEAGTSPAVAARRAGFSDTGRFIGEFSRRFGVPPSEYAKSLRDPVAPGRRPSAGRRGRR